MTNFFTLIYFKTNRFSDEKFCIGILAHLNGIPHFGYSITKLNIASKYVNKDLSKAIKKSFLQLEKDVNKILNGQEALSLFDQPYSKKILSKLVLKKRGVVQFSELFELNPVSTDFNKLYKKFIGEPWRIHQKINQSYELSFNKRFFSFVANKKFDQFDKKYKLSPEEFPLVYGPIKIDMFKKESFYTAFQLIDFTATLPSIQKSLNNFRLIRESLDEKANKEELSKGRYYLVYETPKDIVKRQLVKQIKQNSYGYKLISMAEMYDEI